MHRRAGVVADHSLLVAGAPCSRLEKLRVSNETKSRGVSLSLLAKGSRNVSTTRGTVPLASAVLEATRATYYSPVTGFTPARSPRSTSCSSGQGKKRRGRAWRLGSEHRP